MISFCFQGKPFSVTVIQVYSPTSNAEEAGVEWFWEDLRDLLGLPPKKDVLFTIGDWNAKVGSQKIPGVTSKFGLGIQNEAGQRLTVLPRECTDHSKHPLPANERRHYEHHKTVNTRDITLSTKFHLVKAMVFLVIMYGYESWTIMKAEH